MIGVFMHLRLSRTTPLSAPQQLRFNRRFLRALSFATRANALAVDQAFFGSDFENAVDFGNMSLINAGMTSRHRPRLRVGPIACSSPGIP